MKAGVSRPPVTISDCSTTRRVSSRYRCNQRRGVGPFHRQPQVRASRRSSRMGTDDLGVMFQTCDGIKPPSRHVTPGVTCFQNIDTRGSRVGPNTCPPGVTSSEPPIREGSTTPSEPTLFEVVEPTAQHPAVQAPKRTEGQRVKHLADLYYNAVQGMTNHTKVRSVVKAAITRGISDEEIERGLLHHAADGRWALTLDSLRIAVNRSDPAQDNQERRGNLRVVGGSRQEIPDPSTGRTSPKKN